jgi:hypothetical protein
MLWLALALNFEAAGCVLVGDSEKLRRYEDDVMQVGS